MKISELIAKLEEIKSTEGDLRCMAQDGLDPSDWEEVSRIDFIEVTVSHSDNLSHNLTWTKETAAAIT